MDAASRAGRLLRDSGLVAPSVVLLDGRSGSGKTVLAAQLASLLGAQTLHLDDLYPGWGGLAAGSRAVSEALRAGTYRRYDWAVGEFSTEVILDRGAPLVVEGCGALSATNLSAARAWAAGPARPRAAHAFSGGDTGSGVLTVWLDCPAPVRRKRALARDGDMYQPHWDEWAAQEEAHLAAHQPVALAAAVVHSVEPPRSRVHPYNP